MPTFHTGRFTVLAALWLAVTIAGAQSVSNSGSINGSVVDPTGAVVAKATVEIRNPVSGFDRSITTDDSGKFAFTNIPFNPYHLVVTAEGFAAVVQDVEPRSSVPVNLTIKLQLATSTTQVTVEAEGGDLVENDSTFHSDIDKSLFDKLPLESASSSLSSLLPFQPRASRPIPMAYSTGSAITPRTRFRWTDNPSRTSRARYSPTRFRSIRFSLWK